MWQMCKFANQRDVHHCAHTTQSIHFISKSKVHWFFWEGFFSPFVCLNMCVELSMAKKINKQA